MVKWFSGVTHSRDLLNSFIVEVPVALNKVLAADTLIALVVGVTGFEVIVFHPPPETLISMTKAPLGGGKFKDLVLLKKTVPIAVTLKDVNVRGKVTFSMGWNILERFKVGFK